MSKMNTEQMTCEQMIEAMKNMENGERIKYLDYLFHNHFDSRIQGDVRSATKHYIEGYIDRKLTEEESIIVKLAYEYGHFVGGKDGMEKALKKVD